MAGIPYNQLKGQGYLIPTAWNNSGLGSTKTISIGPPTCTGSAYFTMEAVRLSSGFYDGTSSTTGLGTFANFSGIDIDTLITSSNIFSIVIPPGSGAVTFDYTPTNTIPANTMYARATGGITFNT
jgi:hypothetical protein